MFQFKIWVDADSFPSKARQCILSHAKSRSVPVRFVANHELKIDAGCDIAEMVVCSRERGAADDYICDHVSANDIVVTRDIPFAARLVEKKISVLNDRGVVFTPDSIADRLREREFSLNLAEIGLGGGKENYYGEKELRKFSSAFERALETHIMNETYHIK